MRKFINIITELSISDFGGGDGDGGGETVQCYEIDWDTDGEEVELPSSCTIEIELEDVQDENELRDRLADALSDEYGWCVNSFQYRRL